MMMTYSLLATLLIVGAGIACVQRLHRNTLPQQVILDRLSEKHRYRK
ncbi:hypothetical protein [Thalassolituus marinus]|uniref:Uncharacterized protein n=1 Tax=Thalassolituus marinus TaxID=671053 RepID=A0ABS7ZWZ5_9GAMM|nr:hypothetical protein [Thalassolituus marinus]MCA6065100.1 hypothetical protein [Thalassolituus marinus]